MVKETAAPMSKNSAAMALHPPYLEMIKDAISTMKDRTGSSQQAISKFIEDKYRGDLSSNFNKVLSLQLKKLVKSERLLKVKNSFKISPTEKPKSEKKDLKKKMAAHSKNHPKQEADAAKETSEKGAKTKRLSQVKTPELMKMAKKKPMRVGERTKKLSQIKTPDVFKKKKNPTSLSKKDSKTRLSSKPAKTGSK